MQLDLAQERSMKIETYTGGMLETNGYYLPEARVLIDAPEGIADEAKDQKWQVDTLLLTHGHYDHIWDAAAVRDQFGCRVLYHPLDRVLLTDPTIWRRFGLMVDLPPVEADADLKEGDILELGPVTFEQFHIPGHCAGSICFYDKKAGVVFGGDVLFAGGVGRWDLPGGSQEQLFTGIRTKLYPLPDETRVYPGHGPSTTIGRERATNPFVR
jgi:glyoxylase-like metal-dependent hydrolase (beta-lactamase superfamily II)